MRVGRGRTRDVTAVSATSFILKGRLKDVVREGEKKKAIR